MPLDRYGPSVPFVSMTPAISKCAHGISSGTNAERNPAAVALPASRPPVLFKSALCVGEIESE